MDSNGFKGAYSLGEHFNLDITVADFINIVKSQQISNENIRKSIANLGEVISVNSIPNIYRAAGFEVIDSRKKMIEPTSKVDYKITLKDAIPLARSLRTQSEKQKDKPKQKPKNSTKTETKAVLVNVLPPKTTEFTERIYSNPFPIEQAAEAKEFILAALELTATQLESIKNLTYSNNESNSNPSESIYEAIKQLGGRERMNKTYYISKEVIERVADFSEDKSIKVSQFVEIALLDAISKYK